MNANTDERFKKYFECKAKLLKSETRRAVRCSIDPFHPFFIDMWEAPHHPNQNAGDYE